MFTAEAIQEISRAQAITAASAAVGSAAMIPSPI